MMRVGRDVGTGFEILNDRGEAIAIVSVFDGIGKTGKVIEVDPVGSYRGAEQLPSVTPEVRAFAEEEARRRKLID